MHSNYRDTCLTTIVNLDTLLCVTAILYGCDCNLLDSLK